MASMLARQGIRCQRSLLTSNKVVQSATRFFFGKNIDDDGAYSPNKTTVSFVKEERNGIFVEAYSKQGFTLQGQIKVVGPCILFPRNVLSWDVGSVEEVTSTSLSLLRLLVPQLDVLVIGVGDGNELRRATPAQHKDIRSVKVNYEMLTTPAAIASFNFLQSEGRFVAAALIPPQFITTTYDDLDPLYLDRSAMSVDMENTEKLHQHVKYHKSYTNPQFDTPPPLIRAVKDIEQQERQKKK